jgi:rubredoxin|tara:strand:- start:1086 stop:1247 length:162 start_codon:yes stop_codon:yes gene_type:complete
VKKVIPIGGEVDHYTTCPECDGDVWKITVTDPLEAILKDFVCATCGFRKNMEE